VFTSGGVPVARPPNTQTINNLTIN